MLLAVMGLALTLLALTLRAGGGSLRALRALGEEARRDPLALAVASLLAATAEALAIGLALRIWRARRHAVALARQAPLRAPDRGGAPRAARADPPAGPHPAVPAGGTRPAPRPRSMGTRAAPRAA